MITLYGHQLNALFKIIDMHWHAIEYIGCMSIEHMHILWNSTDMHCSDLKFKFEYNGHARGPRWHAFALQSNANGMQAGTCRGVQFKSLTCNCKSLTCNWHALTCIETRLKFIECICKSLTCFLLFIDMQFKWVWLHCNSSKLWLASIEIQVIGI